MMKSNLKLKAMTATITKTAVMSGSGGSLAFIALAIVLPRFSIDESFGNNWTNISGLIGLMVGIIIVGAYAGTGYQLGVARQTMVKAYLLAQAATAAVVATLILGYTWLAQPTIRQILSFAGFLQPGHWLASWVYLVAVGFAVGILGLGFGMVMLYIHSKVAILISVILLPIIVITAGMIAFFASLALVPAFAAVIAQPWLVVGLIAGLAAIAAAVFGLIYRRLDVPQEGGRSR